MVFFLLGRQPPGFSLGAPRCKQEEDEPVKRSKTVKAKSYVCTVCGRKSKAKQKVECCGKDMVAEKRGSWNL